MSSLSGVLDTTTPYWQRLFSLCRPPSGDDLISFTASGTVDYFPDGGRSSDANGSPENRIPDSTYSCYGPEGMYGYSFCILLRSESDGAPPPSPDPLDQSHPPDGVSQNQNVAMPGTGADYTAAQWAELAYGLTYPIVVWGIYNDIRYEDNSGSLDWEVTLPDHAPARPINLHSIDACEGAQITLDWEEGSDSGATETVRYKIRVNSQDVDDDNITSPHYVLTSETLGSAILIGTTYTITVAAVDACGNVSAWSDTLSVVPCTDSPPPALSLQLAEQTGCEGKQFTAHWTDVGADSVDVFVDGVKVKEVDGPPPPTSTKITGLVLRRTFQIWLVAHRTGYAAMESNHILVKPCCPCHWTRQAAPGGTWTPVPGC